MSIEIKECNSIPQSPNDSEVYRLLAIDRGSEFYAARTDRNIGWITPEEQNTLKNSVVGIAGCGGMGGLLASHLLRVGVGEIRIADCELFDTSNLNRQFAALQSTIGESKAFATARMLREISDDSTLVVYPQGISGNTVDSFLSGCDIICDEIEFWAVGARILLHEKGAEYKIPLLNCSTVGFGSRLFRFDHTGMSMGEMLGFDLSEAYGLQERIANRTATPAEIRKVFVAMLNALIPELPEYGLPGFYQSKKACIDRLFEECTASIIGTNPPLATGLVADHVVFSLLNHYGNGHRTVRPPSTPGYLFLDAALMEAKSVSRKEVDNDYLD